MNTTGKIILLLLILPLQIEIAAAQDVPEFIDQYCVKCHNFEDWAGSLDLEGLDFNMSQIDMGDTSAAPYIESLVSQESYRETNETDLIVRRSKSLNQAKKIKNKLSYKNMGNELKKLHIDIIK